VEEDSKIESATEKFRYAQDFGERTDGKKNPTLFIYTTQTNTLEPITIVDANIYPARPTYDKEGNIYIDGILKTPVVLSPLYCSNRNSAIYKLTKCGQNWKTTLITNEYMIEGHNMSNDGSTLVYFTHDQPCVEHSICFSMKAIDILSYQKTTIVPLKNSTDKFKGIYGCSGCPSLTEDCGFLNSGDYYLLSTESLDKMTTLLINLKTNEIIDINDKFPELSCEIISYSKNYAVLRLCSNLKAPLFYFVFFEESKYSKVSLTWVPLFNSKCPLDLSLYQKTQISTKDSVGYLISPIQPKAPTPLIVALHGGPHSSFCDTYSMTFTLYLQMGYSVLYINFRGSTGYGEDYCKSLSGHVGDYDVKDCGEITKLALENKNIDKRNVFVSGGSHGGFLGCWMCVHEEYSSLFAAGCVGNPACNILGMLPATDIPDWCFATALNDSYHLPATSEEVQKMYNASPIQYVKNAKFPLAFFIGLKDKRVPPFVGKDFYHAMRLNGKKAKLYCFPEESHPIDSVEGLFVQLFDRLLWFDEHKTL
jgi:acylaminoacyl-peptidase